MKNKTSTKIDFSKAIKTDKLDQLPQGVIDIILKIKK